MSEISELLGSYERTLKLHWRSNVSGAERIWFVVYAPAQERRLRRRLVDFQVATQQAGKKWRQLDLADCFGEWLAEHEYSEAYLAMPEALPVALDQFAEELHKHVAEWLSDQAVDEDTVSALYGTGALYGLASTSALVESVAAVVRGRLLVFFPGSYAAHSYRLLGAGGGWNYLAVPITANGG